MRSYFKFGIRGADWWWPVLLYWVAVVAVEAVSILIRSGSEDTARAVSTLAVTFACSIIMGLGEAALAVVIYRRAAPKLSLDGDAFAFDGPPGRYVLIVLVGSLLSLITAGIYLPWFLRRVQSFLASSTRYRESRFEFLGRPLALLPLFLVLVVVAAVLAGVLLGARGPSQVDPSSGGAALATTFTTFALILLVMPILIYVIYKWAVHYRWNDVTVRWQTWFFPSFGFMVGQLALAMITLGIYWPAACLRLYRYFVRRSVLLHEGVEIGRLGFEGRIGRGFWFLWGQSLLSLVTAGIYLPWGLARMGRWVLDRTWLERGALPRE